MVTLHEFNNLSEANEHIVAALSQLVESTDRVFTLALAGGQTPKGLYESLSNQPWPWPKVQITLTDERWVNVHDELSNEAMVRKSLMKGKAEQAYFLPLKNQAASAREGQQECETQLATQLPHLDVAILGMGDDGHFASIFPSMENTDALLDLQTSALCMATQPNKSPERMSLTLAYLLTAKQILLLCAGKQKRKILDDVLNLQASTYPVFHLLHQQSVPVDVCWSAS